VVCLYYIIKRKEMIHIATELKTSITYTGTGSQKLFDIPFDYLRTSFVKTNVDDIVLTYGEDYVIINRQIEFTVAPISGSHVVIYRETTTDRLVSWADASVLKASDMTINQVQQLHILEEQQDWTKTNSIVMEGTIGWNARFHRIINVGDPVEPQDAVTKQYVEDVKTGFISEMIKVKNSAITEITDIKNKAIEAINNLKASTETYLTQLKDTFKSFVTEKTEEVNSLKESADTSATTATKEADRAKKEADRAQDIVDNLEGLPGITGVATTEEALAGESDTKIMTPLKSRLAIKKYNDIPVGFIKFNPLPIIENGWVNASLGTLTQRELYADLWAWVEQHPELLKTEAEWQAIEATNEGHVPFYSSGDETTTFRLPKILWAPCATDDTQKYGNFATDTQRNITGSIGEIFAPDPPFTTGAFSEEISRHIHVINDATANHIWKINFDASKSVGSDHTGEEVKPKTHYGCYVVKAYGTVTNTGNIDVQQVVATQSITEGRVTLLEDNKADNDKLSMPSDTRIRINITASGQTYTAPADGWIYTESISLTGGAWMLLVVDNTYAETASNFGMEASVLTNVPVKKGAVVKFTYAMNHNIFFVPALSSI